MFERKNMRADASDRHFGIMVRDANQVAEAGDKLTKRRSASYPHASKGLEQDFLNGSPRAG